MAPISLTIAFQFICVLFSFHDTHGVIYEIFGSNSTYSCTDATSDDTCILHCDQDKAPNTNDFDCGNAHDCYFYCESNACITRSALTASSSTNLYVYGAGTECFVDANIYTATYSYFQVHQVGTKEFSGLKIHSNQGTESIIMNCTSSTTDTCKDIVVNAESASFLEMVSRNGWLQDATINCPENSNYNGPLPASCIIDFSVISGSSFYTLNGIPNDIMVYGDLQNTVTIYCSAGSSSYASNSFEGQGDCWITSNPTAKPTSYPAATANPSMYPSSSPSLNPASNPLQHPTNNQTSAPIYPPSMAPISAPTQSPIPSTISSTVPPTSSTTSAPTRAPSVAPIPPSLPPITVPTLAIYPPPTTAPISSSFTPLPLVTHSVALSTRETVADSEDEIIKNTINLMKAVDTKWIIIIVLIIVIVMLFCIMCCRYSKKQRDTTSSEQGTPSLSDDSVMVQLPSLPLNDAAHSGSLTQSIKKVAQKLDHLTHPRPNNADFMHSLTMQQAPHIDMAPTATGTVSSHDFNAGPSNVSSYATANTSHDFNAMPSLPSSIQAPGYGEASRMTLLSSDIDISPNVSPVDDTKPADLEVEGMLVQMADASSQSNLNTSGRSSVFKQHQNKMDVLEEKQEYEDSGMSDAYFIDMQRMQPKSEDVTPKMVDAASTSSFRSRHHLNTADASSARNSVIIHEHNETNDDVPTEVLEVFRRMVSTEKGSSPKQCTQCGEYLPNDKEDQVICVSCMEDESGDELYASHPHETAGQ